MTINVIVADQERIFADALVSRLSAEGDMEVVLAVQVRAPGPWLVAGKNAEVMVLDGDLPGEAANRLCAQLSGHADPTRVVILSSSSEPGRIVEAIRSGAVGWLRKDESLERLLDVIRGVARGETRLPASETGEVLRLLMRGAERQRENERLLALLTTREREVLACLADGAGHRAIAETLNMSVNTVRTHLQNLMTKVGAHSALEAVALTRDNDGPPARNGLPGGGIRISVAVVSSLYFFQAGPLALSGRPHGHEVACVRWGMCSRPQRH
jgi:DNA-binding NarL/FixJ family response regulator